MSSARATKRLNYEQKLGMMRLRAIYAIGALHAAADGGVPVPRLGCLITLSTTTTVRRPAEPTPYRAQVA